MGVLDASTSPPKERYAVSKDNIIKLIQPGIADSDEVARVYRYGVARGFRDDVAHLSDLISPGGEAFWLLRFSGIGQAARSTGIAA